MRGQRGFLQWRSGRRRRILICWRRWLVITGASIQQHVQRAPETNGAQQHLHEGAHHEKSTATAQWQLNSHQSTTPPSLQSPSTPATPQPTSCYNRAKNIRRRSVDSPKLVFLTVLYSKISYNFS